MTERNFTKELLYTYYADMENGDAVEEWLPKEHDTNSYEWNKCVRMIREKLWEQSE